MGIRVGFGIFPGGSAWLVQGDHDGKVVTDGGFHHEGSGSLPEELPPADEAISGDLDALGKGD